jgi:hypothetical protein
LPHPDHQTITVAMATRNGARYVVAQLESILAQHRPPDEIVVCDDASTDGTYDIVSDRLGAVGIPHRIERNSQALGPIRNFALAISLTHGSVIALSDQDDVWEPEKLAVIERMFSAEASVLAVFSDASLIDDDGRPLPGSLWQRSGLSRSARAAINEDVLGQLCRWNIVTGATLSFRSSLLPMLLPPPDAAMHDHWIALMAATTGDIRAVPRRLVRYRLHGANTVGLTPRNPITLVKERVGDVGSRADELVLFDTALRRARAHGAPDHTLHLLGEKVAFLRDRAQLSFRPLGRLPTVARHLLAGHYHQLGHGARSVAHDLVIGA